MTGTQAKLAESKAHVQGRAAPEVLPLAEAIEVVAMLGDSVVDVRHLQNSRGGHGRGKTRALVVLSVFLLLSCAAAFYVAVGAAADNDARLQAHLWAGKSFQEFRPSRLSAALDWVAFGGGLGGLITLVLGLGRLGEERAKPEYRVGNAPTADFPLDDAFADDVPLLAPGQDNGFVVSMPRQWQVDCLVGDEAIPVSLLLGRRRAQASAAMRNTVEFPVAIGARYRVATGRIDFLVSAIGTPRRQGMALLAAVETRYMAYLAKTTVAVIVLMFLLDTHFEEEMTLYDDAFSSGERLAHVESTPAEGPVFRWKPVTSLSLGPAGGTGTQMAEAEGRMGKPGAEAESARYAIEKREVPPQLARAEALAAAKDAGVLGVLRHRKTGAFAAVTGAADFSSGLGVENVYGGLLGNSVGEMSGGWGYGISATGPGGGGTGWGTIGAGNFGTLGHGIGTGNGYGSGAGRGGANTHRARVPRVSIIGPSVTGDLDRNIIRRYIRRKLPQIRHCYEKELLVQPDLSGTLDVHFQISPQGLVVGASADGLGNVNVETCVADVIRSIRFPKPPGSGYVQVHYPFVFAPSGNQP